MREVEILKKKQLKCYLYTRVSTSMQVDGYSLDAQRDKLRKYAAYEDMVVAGEYSDEGFSGKNIQGRQEFQRMLNDIQDCKDGVSYVLVFKLSRFGRNAADVLNSLQLMQDFGVNLICVEDGIDSSKDAGKLMISVLSAVAEIERENIRTQTMAGREQKAREGKWNGGFAPYGYKLEDGNLVVAEDEVEVIRVIYDRYIHTNEGVAGVAKYLNRNGYVKKLRQNNTIPGFSRDFVKNVLYNPVYMGKIAYGRRRTEKKQGTRNEIHVVEQSEFPVYEGQHEAIISEEDWYLAQEKRKINSTLAMLLLKEPVVTEAQAARSSHSLRELPGQFAQLVRDSAAALRGCPLAAKLIAADAVISVPCYLTKMFLQQRLVELGWPTEWLFLPLLLGGAACVAGTEIGRRVHPHTLRRFYTVCALLVGGGTFLVGAAPAWGGILGMMLVQGVLEVWLLHADQRLNALISSDQRATLISVDSMAYSILMIPASPFVGAVGDFFGQAGAGLALLGVLTAASGAAVLAKRRS